MNGGQRTGGVTLLREWQENTNSSLVQGHIAAHHPHPQTKTLHSQHRPNNTTLARLLLCSHASLNTEGVNMKKSVWEEMETVVLCLCGLLVGVTILKQYCCYWCCTDLTSQSQFCWPPNSLYLLPLAFFLLVTVSSLSTQGVVTSVYLQHYKQHFVKYCLITLDMIFYDLFLLFFP